MLLRQSIIRYLFLLLLFWCSGTSVLYAQESMTDTLNAAPLSRRARKAAVGRVRERTVNVPSLVTLPDSAKAPTLPDSITIDSMLQTPLPPVNVDSLRIIHLTDSVEKESWFQRQSRIKPDPIRAMWLGLAFPGAGQIYNRKYWKLPIVYGGFLGCTYALTWNSQMLSDYQQAYLDIMDSDPNTCSYLKMLPMGYDITGREARFKTIFKNKKDYFRKYRDLCIFAFAAVYLISVVDAYVDAELSTFDISRDLSFEWEPTFIETDYTTPTRSRRIPAVQCKLKF